MAIKHYIKCLREHLRGLMYVAIKEEAGYEQALEGISLSYKLDYDKDELHAVALKLCNKDGGHNKFLESMQVWVRICAPLYWWKQFDTYRIGITKQSESTMHTIMRRHLVQHDFEAPIFEPHLKYLNQLITDQKFSGVINNLPDGYLQTRMVNLNYKTIRHIIKQRSTHKLGEWRILIDAFKYQLHHPEFLEG